MTMFSMKPKFDLAEFLAEPARPGTRTRARPYRRPPEPAAEEATQESAETKD